jgi:hypothetical protein
LCPEASAPRSKFIPAKKFVFGDDQLVLSFGLSLSASCSSNQIGYILLLLLGLLVIMAVVFIGYITYT